MAAALVLHVALLAKGRAAQRRAAAALNIAADLLFGGRAQRQARHARGQVHVGANAQHGGVLLQLAVLALSLLYGQTSLYHGFQAVHEQLAALGRAVVL